MSTIPPPYTSKVVRDDGYMTEAWRSFNQSVFDITGSADGQLSITTDTITSIFASGDVKVKSESPNRLTFNSIAWPNSGTANHVLVSNGSNALVFRSAQEVGLGFSTGDIIQTLRNDTRSGWLKLDDGTIGNASSNASSRANDDTQNLFIVLWTTLSDSEAPVSGGRGTSALNDFNANKTITLPATLGHAWGVAGTGSGLTTRTIGDTVGAETHTLDITEIVDHVHTIPAYANDGGSTGVLYPGDTYVSSGSARTDVTGSDNAHNNMQPTLFLNSYIKL